jgi:hypothetical protein
MAYISNLLTHWVGAKEPDDNERYDILVNKIVRNRELLYNWNNVPFSSKHGGFERKDSWGVDMVSFTDIPLCESENHCRKYSHFGISFIKSYMANSCVAPVAYALNPFICGAYSYIFHSINSLKSVLDGQTIPEGKKSGEVFRVDAFMQKFHAFIAFTQNYCDPDRNFEYVEGSLYPGKDQIDFFEKADAFYFEREWRSAYRPGDKFCWVKEREGRHYFTFADESIRYVIVPKAYQAQAKKDIPAHFTSTCVPQIVAFEDLKSEQYDQ